MEKPYRMDLNVKMVLILGYLLAFLGEISIRVDGVVTSVTMRDIIKINRRGISYLGLVVPNSYEMSHLLQSPSFVPDQILPYLDFSGRRFRVGRLGNESHVIMVVTGLSMLNAGIATELLISLFKVKAVVHFGIAGNANPEFQIGDVVIPQYWAHTGLWTWQRDGNGPDDELPFESNSDYTRKIGYLHFSDYNNDTSSRNTSENLLNNVWYQPEEIFPVDGTPEVRQHAFWISVDDHYYSLALRLEGMKLESCINSTCLERPAKVKRVERGSSANVFVDNAAYRQFIHLKFNVTPIDMESAAVALICLQLKTPFIVIRALSDLAGGGNSKSNEATIFSALAAQNAVDVLLQFITLLS